jgi:hypothetical protein
MSLWEPWQEVSGGYELRAPWGGWVPAEPGSVVRGLFGAWGEVLSSVRVNGDGQVLSLRRCARFERPCVWVTDGYPAEGGMRLRKLPGERPSRWELAQREKGARWQVELLVPRSLFAKGAVADFDLLQSADRWDVGPGGAVGVWEEALHQEAATGAPEGLGSPIMPVMSS